MNLKKILAGLVLINFAAGFAFAQKIQSNSTWPSNQAQAKKTKSTSKKSKKKATEVADIDESELLDAELVSSPKVKKSNKKTKTRVIKRIIRKKARPSNNVVTRVRRIKKAKQSNFHLTPVAGGSFYTIDGNYLANLFPQASTDVQFDAGFSGGILAEYSPANSWWGVELGAIFTQVRVFNDDLNALNFAVQLDRITNNYVFVPLSAKVYPIRRDKFSLYIKAGVMAGFLTQSDISFQNGSIIQDTDGTDLFTPADFEGAAGLGGQIKINPRVAITLEAIYSRSFSDISESGQLNPFSQIGLTTTTGDAFNEGFTTTLGATISL